jgi:hypothetical protein
MTHYLCEVCHKQIQGNIKTAGDVNHSLHFHEDCLLTCLLPEAIVRYFWPIIDDITVKKILNDLI